MTVPMPYLPPNVYLLADNLDAALAAGEDIMKARLVWETGRSEDGEAIARTRAAQRAILQTVRSLEQILVARILKSRERSEEIAKRDARFATVARLYNAGTAVLIEAVGDYGNAAVLDFENGGDAVAFLRARGLIAQDAPGPSEGQTFLFRDDYLVAGRVRLGTLLDLVALYLDTLEIHFDLFSDDAIESDLLPGEVDAEALAPAAPVMMRDAAEGGDEDTTAGADEKSAGDVDDSLRKALLEVRNLVSLDQR